MIRKPTALALLALCVGLLALGFGLLRRPGSGSVPFEPARDQVPTLTQSAELERVESAHEGASTDEGRRSATEPAAQVRLADFVPHEAGTLELRAVDARTGAPLQSLRVRLASSTRLADRLSAPGSAELRLTLTPGSYSLLALSPGYEPLELSPLGVVAGQTLAPEPLRMRAASARVAGFATGDLRPERGLQAELFGDGRSPCAQCPGGGGSDPCPACGYALEASRRTLGADGPFAFEHLLAGSYALRLVDAEQRTIGAAQALELREGQDLRLDLAAPALRTLEVELLDTDGRSLAGEWGRRVRAQAAAADDVFSELVVTDSSGRAPEFTCTFRSGERSIAETALEVPEPPDGAQRGYTAVSVSSGGHARVGSARPTSLDDRPRAPFEALRPESRAPVIEATPVRASVGEDGLARFEPLPATELLLELSSGPFAARTTIPPSSATTRVQARLRADAGTYAEFERAPRR